MGVLHRLSVAIVLSSRLVGTHEREQPLAATSHGGGGDSRNYLADGRAHRRLRAHVLEVRVRRARLPRRAPLHAQGWQKEGEEGEGDVTPRTPCFAHILGLQELSHKSNSWKKQTNSLTVKRAATSSCR